MKNATHETEKQNGAHMPINEQSVLRTLHRIILLFNVRLPYIERDQYNKPISQRSQYKTTTCVVRVVPMDQQLTVDPHSFTRHSHNQSKTLKGIKVMGISNDVADGPPQRDELSHTLPWINRASYTCPLFLFAGRTTTYCLPYDQSTQSPNQPRKSFETNPHQVRRRFSASLSQSTALPTAGWYPPCSGPTPTRSVHPTCK